MKNGKISTSTMIRLLMKHAKDAVPWTATAPETPESEDGWTFMKARVDCFASGVIIQLENGGSISTIPWREDWTIHQIPNNLQCIGEFKQYGHYTDGLLALTSDLKDLPKGTFRVYVESKP